MKTSKVPNIWENSNPDKIAGFKSKYDPININNMVLPEYCIGYYDDNSQSDISLLKISKIITGSSSMRGDILVGFEFIKKLSLKSDNFKSRLPTPILNRYIINYEDIEFKEKFHDLWKEVMIEKNKFETVSISLNSILFGPPGTGKTFSTKEKSISQIKFGTMEKIEKEDINKFFEENYGNQIRFITFHPSYSYEDFIEGLRPDIENKIKGELQFIVNDGIFKSLCLDALNEFIDKDKLKDWKSYKENKTSINNNVREIIKDKEKFKSLKKYVIIIDEINRGDISKIFGELITLIEEDKRIGKDNQLIVELPYSRDIFGIPPNVFILGTMNTADRSLALLDIALRRRFDFIEMKPLLEELRNKPTEFGVKIPIDKLTPSIDAVIKINKILGENADIGKDKKIGHAYFSNIDNESKVYEIWKNRILPLLEEYYFFDKGSLVRDSSNNYSLNLGWDFQNDDSDITKINKIIQDYINKN